jgi:hypothetical protein
MTVMLSCGLSDACQYKFSKDGQITMLRYTDFWNLGIFIIEILKKKRRRFNLNLPAGYKQKNPGICQDHLCTTTHTIHHRSDAGTKL